MLTNRSQTGPVVMVERVENCVGIAKILSPQSHFADVISAAVCTVSHARAAFGCSKA